MSHLHCRAGAVRLRQFRAKPLLRSTQECLSGSSVGLGVKHHLIAGTFLFNMARGRGPIANDVSSHLLSSQASFVVINPLRCAVENPYTCEHETPSQLAIHSPATNESGIGLPFNYRAQEANAGAAQSRIPPATRISGLSRKVSMGIAQQIPRSAASCAAPGARGKTRTVLPQSAPGLTPA